MRLKEGTSAQLTVHRQSELWLIFDQMVPGVNSHFTSTVSSCWQMKKESENKIVMTSYVKQENGQEWTGSGTMETTVQCNSGLAFPLTGVWGHS